MRMLVALLVLLALPSAAAGAVPGGGSSAGPSGGVAAARLAECVTALDQAGRSAVFEGEMRAVRRAVRLQMRFTLQGRNSRDEVWVRVAVPRFDSWNTADPGRRGYVYTKRVGNLLAPADYRAVVRFRWLDARGHAVMTARRSTRPCHQPDLRPDLRVGRLTVEPGPAPGLRRYAVVVRNAGDTAAGAFTVAFTPQGAQPQRQSVDGLGPDGRTVVVFESAPCAPGSVVEIAVDADEQVDEASEGDDRVFLACPG